MHLTSLVPFIVRNVGRNPKRSAFTILGLTVSLFLLVSLLTVVASLDDLLNATAQNPLVMVTHRSGWTHLMPEAHSAAIRRIPEVVRMGRYLFYGGTYGESKGPQDSFPSMGIDGDDPRLLWGEQLVLDDAAYHCFRNNRIGAVVGSQLMKRYAWKRGQTIELQGTAWPVDLRFLICGEADFVTDKGSFIFHREYLEGALKNPGLISLFAVQVRSTPDIAKVSRQIGEIFATTSDPVRAVSQRSFLESFMGMMGNISGLVSGIAVLVMAVVLLLVANSIAMSTRERTSEIAVLKAIGFGPVPIAFLVLGEAMMLGLAGGALGSGIAYACFGGTGFSLGWGFLSGFTIHAKEVALGLLASIAVALLAAALPTFQVLRLRITQAMRDE